MKSLKSFFLVCAMLLFASVAVAADVDTGVGYYGDAPVYFMHSVLTDDPTDTKVALSSSDTWRTSNVSTYIALMKTQKCVPKRSFMSGSLLYSSDVPTKIPIRT